VSILLHEAKAVLELICLKHDWLNWSHDEFETYMFGTHDLLS